MTKKQTLPHLPSKALVFIVATTLALGIIYYNYQLTLTSPQSVSINAINSSTRLVDLSLTSPDNQTIVINLNPNSARVTAGQFYLSYDPAQLGTASVTLGDFFFAKFGDSVLDNGLLSFAAGVSVDSGGRSTSGKAATIKFSKKPTSTTTIFVTKNTTLTGVGYGSNLLKNSASISLSPSTAAVVTTNLITDSVTTTPTPTPNQNHTQTTASTPTPTPTPKPNLVTKIINSVAKPKTATPSPTPTPAAPTQDSTRELTDLTFGNNPQAPTPTPAPPQKQSWLIRFLNWLKTQLANISN